MIESTAVGDGEWLLPPEQSEGVVKALSERADALVADLVQTIAVTPKVVSEPAWMPPPIVGHATCAANVRSVLAAMVSPSAFDPEPAMVNGADRARQRMSVSTLIESDRIAFRRLWRLLVDEAVQHPEIDAQGVQHMTGNLHVAEELFATAMFAGYRDEHQRLMAEQVSQDTEMIDTLLYGRAYDTWRLWEIANYLRLPNEGPFAVIAAGLPCVGYQALPNIEAKLRSLAKIPGARRMREASSWKVTSRV